VKNLMIDGEIAFAAKQFEKEKIYWQNQLSQDQQRVDFPFDYPHKKQHEKNTFDTIQIRFSDKLSEQIINVSNNSHTRLHVILVTGLIILLNKYTGQKDITIGTPIDKQETTGVFINQVLAIRNHVYESMSFKELLIQVRRIISEAREHMNYPLESIVYELGISDSTNTDHIFPLFSAAILLENIHEKSYLQQIPLKLIWNFLRDDFQIIGSIEYDTENYSKTSIIKFTEKYIRILEQTFTNVGIALLEIDILSEEEKQQLLIDFNNTATPYPHNKSIIELFEEQVKRTPDHYSVKFQQNSLTYRELNQRSDYVAHVLKDKIMPQQVIAVIGERNPEIIIGILAILRVGGIYLPIDGHNPDERVNFIMKDSCVNVLLSQESVIRRKSNCVKNVLAENIIKLDSIFVKDGPYSHTDRTSYPHSFTSKPTDIAYIIYTSGTTGKPKGVAIKHKSLVNYICWAAEVYTQGESLDFALYTSIGFDLTMTSIFTPLITGNAVLIYTGWEKEPLIERIVDENQAGVIKITPSHLKIIKDKKISIENTNIKCIIVGGEEFESGLAEAIHKNFKEEIVIYNEYGPTEATVGCMIHRYNPADDNFRTIPIGTPSGNNQIYVLDESGNPVPENGIGEIYIGGESIAKGYINHPELTAQKFLNSCKFKKIPNLTTSFLFKTGDLARWIPDGKIQFLGRKDEQVKIRGFRIELGEIEQQLMSINEVTEAVVILKSHTSGDNFLCAYVVSTKDISTVQLQETLSIHLPDYMVPTLIIKVDSIPLTQNGKVNKHALPEPQIETELEYVAPRNEKEKQLAEIWAEVLKIDISNIGIDSNFFEHGGHSLSGTLMLAKIKKTFNVNLVLVEIFQNPTIRKLSEKIKIAEEKKFVSIVPQEEREFYPLSASQKRLYILQQVNTKSTAFNITRILIMEGALEKEKIEKTCQFLVKRHEGFRTSFLMKGEEAIQRIHRNIEFSILFHKSDDDHAKKIVEDFTKPFDLSTVPLLRVGLIEIQTNKHIFMVEMPHIMADGISMALLVKEFISVYEGIGLPPLKLQYRDYTQWRNSYSEKERIEKEEEYWLNKLSGEIPTLNLPTDYPRPEYRSVEGKSINFQLEQNKTTELKKIALQEEATLYMILLAVFSILLSKISGQEDILIGSPTAGRNHSDLQNTIGDFINTVVLRLFPSIQKTFRTFLKEVREETLSTFSNQDYPFDSLVEKIERRRDTSRTPIFDVVLNFLYDENKFGDELKTNFSDITIKQYHHKLNVSIHDLTLYPLDNGETILFGLEYCSQLFNESTVESLLKGLNEIVTAIIDNPEIKLMDIKLFDELVNSDIEISHDDFDDFGF